MIRYQVMAKFVSPALREIFPNAELVFLGAFVMIYSYIDGLYAPPLWKICGSAA